MPHPQCIEGLADVGVCGEVQPKLCQDHFANHQGPLSQAPPQRSLGADQMLRLSRKDIQQH